MFRPQRSLVNSFSLETREQVTKYPTHVRLMFPAPHAGASRQTQPRAQAMLRRRRCTTSLPLHPVTSTVFVPAGYGIEVVIVPLTFVDVPG